MSLEERTIEGLHEFLMASVLPRYATPGGRAADLGAGSGALAVRLQRLGMETIAADIDDDGYKGEAPFLSLDLNEPDFASRLGKGAFDLITAVEVIEHIESPVGFLRNVRRLLRLDGAAVVTTPNVENAPARVKFLLMGKLRMMGQADPTHISPIFQDLLVRQYLPRARLGLMEHLLYPANGYIVTRPRYALPLRFLARLLPGDAVFGDAHVFVVRPEGKTDA